MTFIQYNIGIKLLGYLLCQRLDHFLSIWPWTRYSVFSETQFPYLQIGDDKNSNE